MKETILKSKTKVREEIKKRIMVNSIMTIIFFLLSLVAYFTNFSFVKSANTNSINVISAALLSWGLWYTFLTSYFVYKKYKLRKKVSSY